MSREFVVYCDESCHEGPALFMTIGGLWIPRERKDEFSLQLRLLRKEIGLAGEVKWSKVSQLKLAAYKRLIDFFFDHKELRFRIIVVEKAALDHQTHHDGDAELGFYKFYFQMLNKWLRGPYGYLVLLDFKKNKGTDRITKLTYHLKKSMPSGTELLAVNVIDSGESSMAQLADLLTGAVGAAWAGVNPGSAKEELVNYIGYRRAKKLTRPSETPAAGKFNIFKINLQPGATHESR